MGDFGDGMAVSDRLHLVELRVAELERGAGATHELDPGAHAAAFAAHGASPGPVEDAEDVAQEIIGSAERTAERLIDSAETVGDVAQETGGAAVEGAADVAAGAAEGVAAPAEAAEEAVVPTDSGTGERSPSRPPHPLMKKLW